MPTTRKSSTRKPASSARRPRAAKLTMADIKARNAASGGFFFSKDTTKFFGPEKNYGPYVGPGGVFFVTSGKTGWKIRQFNPSTGGIKSVSYEGPNGYGGETVRKAAQNLAKG